MSTPKVVIVGAGIGGLSAAARLAHAGLDVTVLERAAAPGGKMRTLPSAAGPVDAGPTVLTLKPVFDELFDDCGARLSDHVTLRPLDVLARHFWDDGTQLDLFCSQSDSAAEIGRIFGPASAREFEHFSARARRLFAAFDAPMMQAPEPSGAALAARLLRAPRLVAEMTPHRTLAGLLHRAFSEPKLVQLFGRYATYVGGCPQLSPALLSLIWEAEARGVWTVDGGMQALARALEGLATRRGATFRYGETALRIVQQGGRVAAVETGNGRHRADVALFNGDPRALAAGLLGPGPSRVVGRPQVEPRSLSAHVLAFAAQPRGPDLAHHNVFFGHDPRAEFDALARGDVPRDATLYVCAQDAATGGGAGPRRFEIIRNAPPVGSEGDIAKEKDLCLRLTFTRLDAFGLRFSPEPGPERLTAPAEFDALFPASLGSLYGLSPHGLTAALKRPRARTVLPGLYLAGGGAHPGAGVPMAALSARHAAAAILSDLSFTSRSRRAAMPGGMSTAFPTTAGAGSASSDS